MVGLLNMSSLIFGLIAWIIPIVNIVKTKKYEYKIWMIFSVVSMSACAIAVFFQLYSHYELVKLEDWAALMDITGVVVSVSMILVVGTILLHIINIISYWKAEKIKS